MIRFLLTSWWLYIPIIGVLVFLTRRNNQKIKQIKAHQADTQQHSIHPPQPTAAGSVASHHKRSKSAKTAGKLGLTGAIKYIHHK